MENKYIDEKEVLDNFHEVNKELLTDFDTTKYEEKIEEKENLLREKDAYIKRFKKITGVYVLLSALTMSSLNSYSFYLKNKFDLYQNKKTQAYENMDKTCKIDDANYEIIDAYLDYAIKNINNLPYEQTKKEEVINSIKNGIYEEAKRSISDYKDSKEEEKDFFYKEFRNKTKEFDEKISNLNNDLAFSNTIFSYAKYINGEVCVPTLIITNSNKINNVKIIDSDIKSIYVPLSSLSEEENKTFKND